MLEKIDTARFPMFIGQLLSVCHLSAESGGKTEPEYPREILYAEFPPEILMSLRPDDACEFRTWQKPSRSAIPRIQNSLELTPRIDS
ncbi:MAG: hypothetical protein QNJ78_09955 [Gammaproteobacteria bacterium]|nr:hypothetical protein [Gammaproteobacteria bacterium]